MKLVKVYYRGSVSVRSYSYVYNGEEDIQIGDVVVVPLNGREKHAIVTEVFPIKDVIRLGE